MSHTLVLRNHQRVRALDLRFVRRMVTTLLRDLLEKPEFELGICFVAAPEMTRLNEAFLRHKGSTDVVTFDYTDPTRPGLLYGEIFICLDEALIQARRFRTTWHRELARYIIHGMLHLDGFDDRHPARRRKMKREEDRLLRQLSRRFSLSKVRGSSLE